MTTLSEALAALDELTCGDPTCIYSPSGDAPTSVCRCYVGYTRGQLRAALAAVVKAAREEVARQENRRVEHWLAALKENGE